MAAKPLDVWLKFDGDADEEATYEANTFACSDGSFCVEWYHNDVGQVSRKWFDSYREATDWYATNGYEDYSS